MPRFSTDVIDSEPDDDLGDAGAAATAAFLLSLRARGIRDTALLRAMESVPRHVFAPPRCADLARADVSLPLPCGQTMLSPATIATLLGALQVQPDHRVLEVGTGSGYLAALLARLARSVTSVERYRTLAIAATERLAVVGETRVQVLHGDGLNPDPSWGFFDRIIMTGSVERLPAPLLTMLGPTGRLVGAVRLDGEPRLVRIDRTETGAFQEEVGALIRMPPLTAGVAGTL